MSHLSHLVGAVVGGYCGYAMGQVEKRTGGEGNLEMKWEGTICEEMNPTRRVSF